MGAMAYRFIDDYDLPEGIVVEVGAERGEGSTQFLVEWCERNGREFYSIDIVERRHDTIVMDGLEWLEQNDQPIAYAYLDNYDYTFDHLIGTLHIEDQTREYETLGLELNNHESTWAHYRQAKEVDRVAPKGAIIVLDDTYYDGRGFRGKGARAVKLPGWRLRDIGEDSTGAAILEKM